MSINDPYVTFYAIGSDAKCLVCAKTVYKMEAARYGPNVHEACFKCSECNVQLDTENAVFHNGVFRCKLHHKALAGQKKNLDF